MKIRFLVVAGLTVILAGKLVQVIVVNIRDRYRFRNLASLPNWPLLGSAGLFLSQVKMDGQLAVLDRLLAESRKRENAPLFIFWNGLQPELVLHHPAPVASLLSSQKHLAKGIWQIVEWVGQGLAFNEGGPQWHITRRLITPCFHESLLATFDPIIHRNLYQNLPQNEETFNFTKYITRLVFVTFLETQMGMDFDTIRQVLASEVIDQFIDALHQLIAITLLKDLNPLIRIPGLQRITWAWREEQRQLPKFEALPKAILDWKLGQQSSGDSLNILDKLVEALRDGKISIEQAKEELYTFLMAGLDTSASVLTWALFLLSTHQQVQAKLRQELINRSIRANCMTSTNELAAVEYLNAVVNESMRLYPVIPILFRRNNHPVDLDMNDGGEKLRVPANVMMGVFTPLLHRNRTIWGLDADEFLPERFLNERDPRQKYPFCFVPFSAGPRNCIGKKYGMMVVNQFLSHLILNRTFTTDQDQVTIRPNFGPILQPFKGLLVKAKRIPIEESPKHC